MRCAVDGSGSDRKRKWLKLGDLFHFFECQLRPEGEVVRCPVLRRCWGRADLKRAYSKQPLYEYAPS
jgi:hypothetical protein